MLPLFSGTQERRRAINLGGSSSSTSHAAILDEVKAKRAERQNARLRTESATKIQAAWRGTTEARRAKAELAQVFDRDVTGVTAMRCLAVLGRDEERLGVWSNAMATAGGLIFFKDYSADDRMSWLTLMRSISFHMLQSLAIHPESKYAFAHLRNLGTLLSLDARSGGADWPETCRNIARYLLQRDIYGLLASAVLHIKPENKSSPSLPLLTPLLTAPLVIFADNEEDYRICLSKTFQSVLTIPLLPNRLPLSALTNLSTRLPFSNLYLLKPSISEVIAPLHIRSKVYLLANLATLTPPRYSKLPAKNLDVYLLLISSLIYEIPGSCFEASASRNQDATQSSWNDLNEDDELDGQVDAPRNGVLAEPAVKLDIDNKTRTRLQNLASPAHVTSLLNASKQSPSTRPALYNFFISLTSKWPAQRDKIFSAILIATSGGLVRELYRGYVRSSPVGKSDDPKALMDPSLAEHWPPLIFLTDMYTQSLVTMGDDEFFGSASASSGAPRNPLTLDELTSYSRQLLNIAFTLYWYDDQTNVQQGSVPGMSIKWEAVRDQVTKCLQAIHARDSRRKFTPPDHWLVTSQINMGTFVEAAVYEERELSDPSEQSRPLSKKAIAYISPRLGVLHNIPFAIPFEVRVTIFRHFIANDMVKHNGGMNRFDRRMIGGRTQAVVRRGHVAADGFDKLANANLKGIVEITFIDQFGNEEAGIDGGGVFKEFFTSLCKEVFDTDRGLWLATKQNELYPNPHSYAKESHSLHWYNFVGRILGKALYEGILVDVGFAGFFLAKWLGKQSFLDDLASLDPQLYQGLVFLKHYPGDPEDLTLNFTVAEDEFGVTKTVDLIPNGSNTPVSRENRLQYIFLVCHYRLTKQIRMQSEAFFQGLSEMIDPKWLRMFNQQELQILIGGVNSPIDLDDLRKNTLYGGLYDDNEETIQRFWKVVNTFDQEQRRALLRFATSCSRPPLLGFKELQPKFAIRDSGVDQTRLPTASTCVNLLKLPRYANEKVMKEKLLQAITSGAGFDLS